MSDDTDGMTAEQKRRDQLLRMSGSTEADAAPRIEVSEHDGIRRIDIADGAAVRPGPGPGDDETSGEPDLREGGLEFTEELQEADAEADDRFGS